VSNLIKEEVNIGATQSEEDPAFPTPHKVNLLRIENVAKELGVSPIQPLVKLSKHQRPQQIKRKASQIRDAVLKKMSSGLQVKVTARGFRW
jgi:diphthamide synthase (EF-2-diphthine--ammonia ligase)